MIALRASLEQNHMLKMTLRWKFLALLMQKFPRVPVQKKTNILLNSAWALRLLFAAINAIKGARPREGSYREAFAQFFSGFFAATTKKKNRLSTEFLLRSEISSLKRIRSYYRIISIWIIVCLKLNSWISSNSLFAGEPLYYRAKFFQFISLSKRFRYRAFVW